MTTAKERHDANKEIKTQIVAVVEKDIEAEPEDVGKPRRPKADIMYDKLGRVSQQLRRFAASLDEDEDEELLDSATKAIALIRSMRRDLLARKGPLTDSHGVTTEAVGDLPPDEPPLAA